jgi:hypothetical protein
MYGIQGNRQARVPDLLEQLKKEYEGMIQESNLMKSQRDDLQGKCEEQPRELPRPRSEPLHRFPAVFPPICGSGFGEEQWHSWGLDVLFSSCRTA